MKRIILILIIFTNVVFGSAADNLINKIRNIQSMSANFNQILIDKQGDSNISSKGVMMLKKPQFFKWINTSPNSQEIISNGKKIWIYNSDLEQLIIKEVTNNISQFPYLILLSKSSDSLSKLFTIKKKSTNIFILKPKNNEMINSITIKFTENGKLDYLCISTYLNQYTKIKFSNVRNNSDNIKSSNFDFKIPKNIDIFDETIIGS